MAAGGVWSGVEYSGRENGMGSDVFRFKDARERMWSVQPGIDWRRDGIAFDEDSKGSDWECLSILQAVADSHDRDAAWIERELGDVEHRAIDATAYGIVLGRPGVVPVESLGMGA